jgi:hypothetical protein
MVLGYSGHCLHAIARGLLKPRLCCPSSKSQSVHLREAALMVGHARCEVSLCSSGLVSVLTREGLRWRSLVERLDQRPQLRERGPALRRSRLNRPCMVHSSSTCCMAFRELCPNKAREVLTVHDLSREVRRENNVWVERPQELIVLILAPKAGHLSSASV